MSVKGIRFLIIALYFGIGVWVAWDHHYLAISVLRTVASVILAVLFWWLIPLGVDLHVRA